MMFIKFFGGRKHVYLIGFVVVPFQDMGSNPGSYTIDKSVSNELHQL